MGHSFSDSQHGDAHGASSHDGHGELGHIVPVKVYGQVIGALMILTVLTVAVSRVDFGNMNLVVGMAIATVKAAIVVLFFMHAKFESPLTWLYIACPLLLLVTMMAGVFIDKPLRPAFQTPIEVEAQHAEDHAKAH